jgi:hypothetical protein
MIILVELIHSRASKFIDNSANVFFDQFPINAWINKYVGGFGMYVNRNAWAVVDKYPIVIGGQETDNCK